ncbi:MAG TPA: ABC transporter substrate-binding protein [Actinomycetota bacterium]|nr:ABC transporter substrate-binding protein [Actinomycetota bacterium]
MRRFLSALTAGVVLTLAACSDPSSSSVAAPTSAAPAFPVTIDTADGPVTLDAQPTQIVSLSPTATEMLFAVGAGDQVIAADDFSDYPPQAPTTDLSGFEPNVEAIAGYEPDLVVISGDPGGVVKGLEALDVPVLVLPAAVTIDDSYDQMRQLGQATGHVGEADAAVAQMQTDIGAALAAAADGAGMSVYHELDDTYYSVTSDTFVGQIYELFGMTNIADEANGAATGYPQLSAEYIVEADPDLIVLADTVCCGQDAEAVAARDGWDGLNAVEDGGVVTVDDSVASRWGPRIVEFIEAISAGVQQQGAA